MQRGWRTSPGVKPRGVVLLLTLVSHLLVTFGFPLPVPGLKFRGDSRTYPCQNRPCGCLSAEQCWAGDCCCFTLEEKADWAEANGVEPPAHVRRLIESRGALRPQTETKPCCGQTAPDAGGSYSATADCCSGADAAGSACAALAASCCERATAGCQHCGAKVAVSHPLAPHVEGGVRWLLGLFAQKCRGEGPAGLLKVAPSLPPDGRPAFFAVPLRGERLEWIRRRPLSVPHAPPIPPPRHP